jgi:hypothetical protein
MRLLISVLTNAVLAIWLLFVPLDAVGVKGIPVNAGLLEKTKLPVVLKK